MELVNNPCVYGPNKIESFMAEIRQVLRLSAFDEELLRLRLMELKKAYNCYFFNLNGALRFLFFTESNVNFSALEQSFGKRSSAYLVEGALLDMYNLRKFVRFTGFNYSNDEIFFKYVIYDSGVPHIVYDPTTGLYRILFFRSLNLFRYVFVTAHKISAFVTHVDFDNSSFSYNRKRVLFFKKDGMEYAFALNELISLRKIESVSLSKCVLSDCKADEVNCCSYKDSSVNAECSCFSTDDLNMVSIPVHIIGGDSFVVVKDNNGVFGNKVMLLLRGNLCYNLDFSCVKLEPHTDFSNEHNGHFLIDVSWIKNDFETGFSVFDVTARRIVD